MRVPEYEQRTQLNPLPAPTYTVQATAEAMGGGIASGLGDMGQALTAIAQQEQAEAEETALMNLHQEIVQYENRVVYDPENGALSKRGENVFGLTGKVGADYGQSFQERVAALPRRVQNRATSMVMNRGEAIQRTLLGHESNELSRYRSEQEQAYLQSGLDNMRQYAADPQRMSDELVIQGARIDGMAKREGWSEARRQLEQKQYESRAYSGVIEHWLNANQPLQARASFDELSASLSAADRGRLEPAVLGAATREEGRQMGYALVDMDETRALSKIMQEHDPLKQQTAATAYYEATRLKQKKVRLQNQQSRKTVMVDYLLKGQSSDIPHTLLQQLPQDSQQALAQAAFADTQNRQTDWQTYYQVEDAILQGEEVDMLRLFGQFNREDMQSLMELQDTLENDVYQNTESLGNQKKALGEIHETLTQIGQDKLAPAYGQFRQSLSQVMQDEQTLLKRELTTSERQKLTDELAIRHFIV